MIVKCDSEIRTLGIETALTEGPISSGYTHVRPTAYACMLCSPQHTPAFGETIGAGGSRGIRNERLYRSGDQVRRGDAIGAVPKQERICMRDGSIIDSITIGSSFLPHQ